MERPTKLEPALLTAGWSRLWQSHHVLWWVYAVNLVLGLFATLGFALRLSRVLDHSALSARLVGGMDLGYLTELASHPDVKPSIAFQNSLGAAALFFLFMLFALGGILQSYHRQRHLVPGEFFQAAGACFWRFVRLLLWTCVFLIPVGLLYALVAAVATRIAANSPHASLEFWLRLAGCAILWIILAVIRLCFDLAQVKAVIEDRRDMTRVLGESIRLALGHLRVLFPLYFVISFIGWIGTALAFWCWLKLPPDSTPAMFLLGQFVALLWIVTRLWQRAGEVAWFERHESLPLPLVMVPAVSQPEVPPLEASAAVAEYVDPPAVPDAPSTP